jgi:very-short-patch-repair endonuclease
VNHEHDPFEYEPEERARDLRHFSTWAEKRMWSWLRNRRLGGYKFRRQHPFGECVLDFFCNEAMLAIEIDGSQHGHPEEQKRDEARTKFLEKCGVKVLRFWNSQLKQDGEMIREKIFRELQARAPKPLLGHTRPFSEKQKRPHPDPLPQGEGTGGD